MFAFHDIDLNNFCLKRDGVRAVLFVQKHV